MPLARSKTARSSVDASDDARRLAEDRLDAGQDLGGARFGCEGTDRDDEEIATSGEMRRQSGLDKPSAEALGVRGLAEDAGLDEKPFLRRGRDRATARRGRRSRRRRRDGRR